MAELVDHPSVWRLRLDLLSVRAMLLLAGHVSLEDLKPEVHLFLGDRYERLANRHGFRGHRRLARRLADKAQWHYAQAGFDDFPRAAAMAMPVPRPRIFTDARGRYLDRSGPDDAA